MSRAPEDGIEQSDGDAIHFEDVRQRLHLSTNSSSDIPYENYIGAILGGQFRLGPLIKQDADADCYSAESLRMPGIKFYAKAYVLDGLSRQQLKFRKKSMNRLEKLRACTIDQSGRKFIIYRAEDTFQASTSQTKISASSVTVSQNRESNQATACAAELDSLMAIKCLKEGTSSQYGSPEEGSEQPKSKRATTPFKDQSLHLQTFHAPETQSSVLKRVDTTSGTLMNKNVSSYDTDSELRGKDDPEQKKKKQRKKRGIKKPKNRLQQNTSNLNHYLYHLRLDILHLAHRLPETRTRDHGIESFQYTKDLSKLFQRYTAVHRIGLKALGILNEQRRTLPRAYVPVGYGEIIDSLWSMFERLKTTADPMSCPPQATVSCELCAVRETRDTPQLIKQLHELIDAFEASQALYLFTNSCSTWIW